MWKMEIGPGGCYDRGDKASGASYDGAPLSGATMHPASVLTGKGGGLEVSILDRIQ